MMLIHLPPHRLPKLNPIQAEYFRDEAANCCQHGPAGVQQLCLMELAEALGVLSQLEWVKSIVTCSINTQHTIDNLDTVVPGKKCQAAELRLSSCCCCCRRCCSCFVMLEYWQHNNAM
jgi:hypothetical protein